MMIDQSLGQLLVLSAHNTCRLDGQAFRCKALLDSFVFYALHLSTHEMTGWLFSNREMLNSLTGGQRSWELVSSLATMGQVITQSEKPFSPISGRTNSTAVI